MNRSRRKRSPETIDAYIDGFPPEVRSLLQQLRAEIGKAAPRAEEAIKYGIPTFVLGENLVHFAAWKRHIGFYPTPAGIAAFAAELSGYRTSKGAVQLPLDRPLPLALIRRSVERRVEQAGAHR